MSDQIKKSRKKTRQCLFQALYSCIYLQNNFDRDLFLASFFEEDFSKVIDEKYFNEVFYWVKEKELELTYLVKKYAPKFDITSMSLVNLVPVFISIYEQLFLKCDNIPYKVSIDEAIELTKTYSDDTGRIFANWVLNSIKANKDAIIEELKTLSENKNLWENKNYFFNKEKPE